MGLERSRQMSGWGVSGSEAGIKIPFQVTGLGNQDISNNVGRHNTDIISAETTNRCHHLLGVHHAAGTQSVLRALSQSIVITSGWELLQKQRPD